MLCQFRILLWHWGAWDNIDLFINWFWHCLVLSSTGGKFSHLNLRKQSHALNRADLGKSHIRGGMAPAYSRRRGACSPRLVSRENCLLLSFMRLVWFHPCPRHLVLQSLGTRSPAPRWTWPPGAPPHHAHIIACVFLPVTASPLRSKGKGCSCLRSGLQLHFAYNSQPRFYVKGS